MSMGETNYSHSSCCEDGNTTRIYNDYIYEQKKGECDVSDNINSKSVQKEWNRDQYEKRARMKDRARLMGLKLYSIEVRSKRAIVCEIPK